MDDASLIAQIYALAEDEQCWPTLLPLLGTALSASHGHIFVLDGAHIEENHYHRIAQHTVDRYHAEFQGNDPRILHAARHVGRVFSDVDVVAPEVWERSRLYTTC